MRLGVRVRDIISKTFIYGTLIAGSFFILLPLIWMISTSLKLQSHVFRFPPEFIPNPVVWSNYSEALTALPFDTYLLNTLTIVVFSVTGEVFMSAVVAYAFSRLKWKGRDVLFVIVIATMMLPGQVTLIPIFILYRQIGWLDTFLPLISAILVWKRFLYLFATAVFYDTVQRYGRSGCDGWVFKDRRFLAYNVANGETGTGRRGDLLISIPLE